MTPYSHPDAAIMEQRFVMAQEAVLVLSKKEVNKNCLIYSPIAYWHPFAVRFKLPTDYNFWNAVDKAAILSSTAVYLLKAYDWENSKGMQAEFQFISTIGTPVISFTPEELGIKDVKYKR